MYDSDSIMICCIPIPSVENNPKNICLGGTIWDELKPEYYNDKNDYFGILFQKYTASAVDNIYHTSIVIEWKANMDKASYRYNHDLGVHIPYVKIKLA